MKLKIIGVKSKKIFLPMQSGDVKELCLIQKVFKNG